MFRVTYELANYAQKALQSLLRALSSHVLINFLLIAINVEMQISCFIRTFLHTDVYNNEFRFKVLIGMRLP